ncbi:hypothetical protein DACRYDRAFT_108664 [Dacryopinax primogenitus]|uniref:Fanconi-associated nuclease n=1 Tax=Dacryopinax primogenitus (strain DJM 731) TaxID=1858805 RepID=M5G9T6_DACPD|nr:uncharacterized protein DACRYDRAFT_108664 [Dacryopinax primogenitus]EJU00598.1 hypothetical protein DACRYDRAFT_108664 [Dacryopinax primogenitus]
MALASSSRFSGSLRFPGDEDIISFYQSDDQFQKPQAIDSESRPDGPGAEVESQQSVWTGESLYVRIFEDIIMTVLEHEEHLFTPSELGMLHRFRAMPYYSRYLLIRLLLRKRGKWHRVDDLRARYSHEFGDKLEDAISELCDGCVRMSPTSETSEKKKSPSNLDAELRKALAASLLSFEAEEKARQVCPLKEEMESDKILSDHSLSMLKCTEVEKHEAVLFFAFHCEAASLDELLETLSLDELRDLARQMKIKHTQNRKQLILALAGHASNQITLSFTKSDRNTPRTSGSHSLLPFTSIARSQEDRVRSLILKKITSAVKLNDHICQIFSRLSLIFFRSTTPTDVLLPLILASFKRRHYPPYETKRTPSIFPTRELLLEYEYALNLEGRVDSLLQGQEGYNLERLEIARGVKALALSVYSQWEGLVAEVGSESMAQRDSLRRFDPGHILTRIVGKLAEAYGQLREYEDEMRILRALLSQQRWRQGKRGGWYERLALILMTHCGKERDTYEEAMKVAITGLEDPKTHLIYRPSLERRLTRLEKKLEVTEETRRIHTVFLRKPTINTIIGIRILKPNALTDDLRSPLKRSQSSEKENRSSDDNAPPKAPPGMKSIWQGRDEEVTVEKLALEWYEKRGYRGFHSEGRIVSTLFTLLFFDILYMPIPGAFETKYQTAPLDLTYDTFYSVRREAIDKRLEELRAGQGPRIIADVDDRERPNQTWCVGVRWDMFEKGDLVGIAEGIGGEGLSAICRLLCEEYGQRGSGVPDLIIWNAAKKTAKFVEVKGPGDNLMETQKIWADVLLCAGVDMEVCRVVEEEIYDKTRKNTPKANKRKVEVIVLDSDDDEAPRSVSRPLTDATAKTCNNNKKIRA